MGNAQALQIIKQINLQKLTTTSNNYCIQHISRRIDPFAKPHFYVNQHISTVNHAAMVMTAKALNGAIYAVNHEETAMTAKEINCRK
jgi:hypothetical protein